MSETTRKDDTLIQKLTITDKEKKPMEKFHISYICTCIYLPSVYVGGQERQKKRVSLPQISSMARAGLGVKLRTRVSIVVSSMWVAGNQLVEPARVCICRKLGTGMEPRVKHAATENRHLNHQAKCPLPTFFFLEMRLLLILLFVQ